MGDSYSKFINFRLASQLFSAIVGIWPLKLFSGPIHVIKKDNSAPASLLISNHDCKFLGQIAALMEILSLAINFGK